MTKEARAAAFSSHGLDVDMVNCHPALLARFASSELGEGSAPVLQAFARNTACWRELVRVMFDVDAQEAKKELQKIVYMGRPRGEWPQLWALSRDARRAARGLLATPAFVNLHNMFARRRNPFATRMSYALMALEDAALENMVSAIDEAMPAANVACYLFDGFVVTSPTPIHRPDLQREVAEAVQSYGVHVKIAEFNA